MSIVGYYPTPRARSALFFVGGIDRWVKSTNNVDQVKMSAKISCLPVGKRSLRRARAARVRQAYVLVGKKIS
jgi:hypothetical protein